MEVSGLCHVCNQNAHFTCSSCGATVCKKHISDKGLCEMCEFGMII